MGRNLVKITFVTSRYSTYLKQSHGRNLISGGFLRRLNACEHLRLLFGTRHGVKVNLAARFLPRGGREREKESSLERSLRIFLRRVVLKIGNHRSCSPWAAVTPPISPAVTRSTWRRLATSSAHPPFFPWINYTIPIKSIKLISIEKSTGSLFSATGRKNDSRTVDDLLIVQLFLSS